MGSRINKIGEENINTFGSKMIIFAYRKNYDVDVYFPEYDWMVNNREYREFKMEKLNVLMKEKHMALVTLVKVNIKLKKMAN